MPSGQEATTDHFVIEACLNGTVMPSEWRLHGSVLASALAWEDTPMSTLVGIAIIVVILWAVRAVIKFY
jgi:hypothetical protein